MNSKLSRKLAKLPSTPGVYFHKSAGGEIIYIGKTANLRNRVRQYFQSSCYRDSKTDLLVAEIADVDWTSVETEVDALFLEAELVRRYLPRYNILLRDDKSFSYVRIDIRSSYPTVTFIRRPLDDGAQYFGPYINSFAVKKALRYLRRAFPYAISKLAGQKRPSLDYHLGLDPGLEDGRTSLADYRADLRKLIQYLRGQRVTLMRDIEKDMKQTAQSQQFEEATKLRHQLFVLQALNRQVLFGDHEIQAASSDQALVELANLLGLNKPPERIEGFDISHTQGSDTTASMVVFASGVPHKAAYRKFKMRHVGNDDFAHIGEAVSRRFKPENIKKWGLSDLVLIDGGKGQLSAALKARNKLAQDHVPMVGLAKRFEEIVIRKANEVNSQQSPVRQAQGKPVNSSGINLKCLKQMDGHIKESGDFVTIILPKNSHIVKLLQRIRDESHRFAVSYHSTLRRQRQTASLLEEIPGFGPATRKKLIKTFGSLPAVTLANNAQLETVIGQKKTAILRKYLKSYQKTKKIQPWYSRSHEV